MTIRILGYTSNSSQIAECSECSHKETSVKDGMFTVFKSFDFRTHDSGGVLSAKCKICGHISRRDRLALARYRDKEKVHICTLADEYSYFSKCGLLNNYPEKRIVEVHEIKIGMSMCKACAISHGGIQEIFKNMTEKDKGIELTFYRNL